MKKEQNTDFPVFREKIQKLEEKETSRAAFLKKIKVDEKTYRNWINGKNKGDGIKYSMPSASNLKTISEAYGVSTDWLLGLSTFTSPENDFIGSYTGLNDTAVKVLASEKKEIDTRSYSYRHHLDMINYLLNTEGGMSILTTMYHYLFGNYTHIKNGGAVLELRDDSHIPCNGADIGINNISALFLSSLIEKLSQEKAKLSEVNTAGYGKYNPAAAAENLFEDVVPFTK